MTSITSNIASNRMTNRTSNSEKIADLGTMKANRAKKGASEEEIDFGQELNQASIQNLSPSQSLGQPQLGFPNKLGELLQGKNLAESDSQTPVEEAVGVAAPQTLRDQVQIQGKSALSGTVEKSPLSFKSAASMNTAHAVAGLKPWSKEWVLEGDPEVLKANSEIKPLFGEPDSLTETGSQSLRTRGGAKGVSPEMAENLAAEKAIADSFSHQMQQGLQAQLQSMGGETVSLNGAMSSGAMPLGESRLAAGNSSLSGSEFLNTLSAIRSAQQDAVRVAGTQGREAPNQEAGQEQSGSQGDKKSLLGPELRVIEGGAKARKPALDFNLAHARNELMTPLSGQGAIREAVVPTVLTGHVTQGAMSQDRLSSESLAGLSAGIRNLSSQAGGEIRVRLNPENLGELHIRVMTSGSQVGLQIQASDEKARKIIEESIGHLKESMAASHLSLGQVDLTVGSAHSSAMNSDSRNGQSEQQQNSPQQNFLGEMNQQNREQNSWSGNGNDGSDRWSSGDSVGSGNVRTSIAGSSSGSSRAQSSAALGSGRIDVRA